MMWLDVESRNFPGLNQPSGNSIQFTQAQLCWASITVGRQNKAQVMTHAGFWAYEAKFRWNMVQAAIDVSAATGIIRNSPLFNALDPTEKGGINYFLGMVFAKLCADQLLGIPWLIHFSLLKHAGHLSPLRGKSSPDFVGMQATSGSWHVIEAKARNGSDFEGALLHAKQQASRNLSVNGSPCQLLIGSVLYREGSDKAFKFVWDDPAADDGPEGALKADRQTWERYYESAWRLMDLQEENPELFQEEFGFKLELDEPIERLRANSVADDAVFENSLEEARQSVRERVSGRESSKLSEDDWNGDGIRVSQVRERRSFGDII